MGRQIIQCYNVLPTYSMVLIETQKAFNEKGFSESRREKSSTVERLEYYDINHVIILNSYPKYVKNYLFLRREKRVISKYIKNHSN